MKKVVLFPFNGEMMCFVHVLLNGLDFAAKGYETAIVIEGAACTLVEKLENPEAPMHGLWVKAREAGIVAGVCKACSATLKVMEGVEASGLPLLDDMNGHAGIARWKDEGYDVITF